MIDLRFLGRQLITPHIKSGGIAADFTMGNGHDTAYLSEAVGAAGHVYAFDIQQQALDNTAKLLEEQGCPNNCTLILDSHANAGKYIKERICVGLFNLGWLPGSDKAVTTKRESTEAAVDAAISLLADDGIVLIAVYPGHAEGTAEGELLCKRYSTLSRKQYCATLIRIINSPDSPYFIAIENK